MTKSTITRDRLRALAVKKVESLKFAITQSAFTNIRRGLEEELQLAEFALAAMDSEPVAVCAVKDGQMCPDGFAECDHSLPHGTHALYAAPQPAPEREQVRQEHAEWSQATFGNVGPVGPLKHLSKEALEAADQPADLTEWADMQFLLWDAQRRAGITDEQITQAMIEKLAVNKQRSWPEPKDGEPRLHIKERPRKKVDRCDVCTEGARGGCGTCIFNGNFE